MSGGSVEVALIRTTLEARMTQVRVEDHAPTVEEYAAALRRRERFPPVSLVADGKGKFLIADGWHRVLAAKRAKAQRIRAKVLPALPGLKPLQSAIRYALRSNTTHGLRLTPGDAANKARRAILEVPGMVTASDRKIAREIGASHQTVSRARNALVREGLIPHPVTEEPRDEVMPDEYAGAQAFRGAFGSDPETYERVRDYVRQLKTERPRDWTFDHAEGRVTHRGLVPGAAVAFAVDDNPIRDGLPSEFERIEEPDDESSTFQPPDPERRAMLDRMTAQREFDAALERVKAHKRPELTAAALVLKKYRRVPKLWDDLQALVLAGGPPQERLPDEF